MKQQKKASQREQIARMFSISCRFPFTLLQWIHSLVVFRFFEPSLLIPHFFVLAVSQSFPLTHVGLQATGREEEKTRRRHYVNAVANDDHNTNSSKGEKTRKTNERKCKTHLSIFQLLESSGAQLGQFGV